MFDPLSNDPLKNSPKPTNRCSGSQFSGLFSSAQPQLDRAAERVKGWASNNPDKMESIGERVGQAAAVGLGGGIIGRKAGKKLGGKLGRMASTKAQGGQAPQELPSSAPPGPSGTQDIPF